MKQHETYNGYANYETWNVCLWIGNDEGLYHFASACKTYLNFVSYLKEIGGPIAFETPDGVSWIDSGLDLDEINQFFKEL